MVLYPSLEFISNAGCKLWRGRGIKAVGIYQGAGLKAKNVTSLFTFLSVLVAGFLSQGYYYVSYFLSSLNILVSINNIVQMIGPVH